MAFVLSALAVAPADAAGACPATSDDAETAARRVAKAFEAMDVEGLGAAAEALRTQLGCLSVAPDPAQAAAVHLAEALLNFNRKDTAGTLAALRAAHESDPSFALSESLAPLGGPLDRRDQEARVLPLSPRVAHGVALTVVVDGRPAADLPVDRPALVVVLGADGAACWSGLVAPGASLPDFRKVELGLPSVSPEHGQPDLTTRPPSAAQSHPTWPLLAAGGAAVLTGALVATYAVERGRLTTAGDLIAVDASDAQWRQSTLQRRLSAHDVGALYDRARSLEVGAQVSGGLALGLGAVGLVVAW